jgi:hypothetical protein
MMKDRNIPAGFIPLVTIGELDGYLMVYTAESHDDTLEILERTIEVLSGTDTNQGMTMQ